MALRQRLNETVDELEAFRRTHTELDLKFESQSSELTVAKSDRKLPSSSGPPKSADPCISTVTLVNKDQLDILKSLRASVSVEKEALSKEVERLRASLQYAEDKNTMQMGQVRYVLLSAAPNAAADYPSQVNALLVEKTSLQSDSIGQREKLLERERDLG